MTYSIMVQVTTGDDSVYCTITENNESITFSTMEDAEVKLTELQSNETEGKQYQIVSYNDNVEQ
jgi:hypothetical protein